jgi:ankyrin repeat protein
MKITPIKLNLTVWSTLMVSMTLVGQLYSMEKKKKTSATEQLIQELQAEEIDNKAVEKALVQGADPNASIIKKGMTYTPLTFVLLAGNLDAATLLLDFGADINAIGSPYKDFNFLWGYLSENPSPTAIQWLIEHDASFEPTIKKTPAELVARFLYTLTLLSWHWSTELSPRELRGLVVRWVVHKYTGIGDLAMAKKLSVQWKRLPIIAATATGIVPSSMLLELQKLLGQETLSEIDKNMINDTFILIAAQQSESLGGEDRLIRSFLNDFGAVITKQSLQAAFIGAALKDKIETLKAIADYINSMSSKPESTLLSIKADPEWNNTIGTTFLLSLILQYRTLTYPVPLTRFLIQEYGTKIPSYFVERALQELTRQSKIYLARVLLQSIAAGSLAVSADTWNDTLTRTVMLAVLTGAQRESQSFLKHILEIAQEKRWDIDFGLVFGYIDALKLQNNPSATFNTSLDQAINYLSKLAAAVYLEETIKKIEAPGGVPTSLLGKLTPELITFFILPFLSPEKYKRLPH